MGLFYFPRADFYVPPYDFPGRAHAAPSCPNDLGETFIK